MFDDESVDSLENTEGHPGNLPGVVGPISHRQPGHDHVGVADRLHLVKAGCLVCSQSLAMMAQSVSQSSIR